MKPRERKRGTARAVVDAFDLGKVKGLVNYYQQDMECASPEAMRALQSERLVKAVRHVYDHVAYYRNKMDEIGLKPQDIRSMDDLGKLPFLTKEDLKAAYPYGLLAKPLADCVRIQSTSGTTGKRVVAFYTQYDIDVWDECCARAIVAAGGSNEDVVHVCYGYGLFTGGPGLNGGSHKVGSLTLPMSSGNTERQLQFMIDLEATILCCTPSYAAFLAESLINQGLRDQIKLKAGIFGAEAWSEEMRRDIEDKLGIKAYDIYGLTEITGPGVSFECAEQTGMHINEDHFVAEIIDPETGKVLPDGEKGELVFTCISKEAFPLLRYRTRDICVLSRKACSCGRTLVKMARLMGRTDDMLIIRGVNVFPSQIETVLLRAGYPSNYEIIVDRLHHTDTFEVKVEMTQEMFDDTVKGIEAREAELLAALRAMLGISPKVTLAAPRSIARSEGKAVRVIDRRKI
jgi:phenylacetate-CoA ligase